MQNPDTVSLGSIATAWEQYGEFVQLMLALLFGWLVLNWLSNVAARVDGLSLTMRDLRQDLDELKDKVKAVQQTRSEHVSRDG